MTISYKAPLYDAGIPSSNGSRRPFSDEPKASPGDIRTFAELIFDFRGRSITESIERLQWVRRGGQPTRDRLRLARPGQFGGRGYLSGATPCRCCVLRRRCGACRAAVATERFEKATLISLEGVRRQSRRCDATTDRLHAPKQRGSAIPSAKRRRSPASSRAVGISTQGERTCGQRVMLSRQTAW